MEGTPEAVNKGNAFAHAAEEYAERGQFAQAIEAHFRAAEQFLLATSYTNDPEATKTLKLLYTNHTRQGKDLQRRLQTRTASSSPSITSSSTSKPTQSPISTASQASPRASPVESRTSGRDKPKPTSSPIQQQAVAVDSKPKPRPVSLPATNTFSSARPTGRDITLPRAGSGDEVTYSILDTGGGGAVGGGPLEDSVSGYGYGSRNFFVGQTATTPEGTVLIPKQAFAGNQQGNRSSNAAGMKGPATVDVISLDNNRPMYDSIERSYFVLGEGSQEVPREDEPEDPFNKFWDAVENLVQKISIPAPLAFTTAPITSKADPETDRDVPVRMPYNVGYGSNRSPYAVNLRSGLEPGIRDSQLHSHSNYPPTNMTETLRTNNMLNSYFVVGDSTPLAASEHVRNERVERFNPSNGTGGIITNHLEPELQSRPMTGSVNVDALNLDSNFFGRAGRFEEPATAKVVEESLGRSTGGSSRSAGPTHSKTREELVIENEQLKQTVDFLTRKMAVLEKAAEENNMLRSSIIQFRQDLHRQAKRFGMPNNPPGSGSGSGVGLSQLSNQPGISASTISTRRMMGGGIANSSSVTSSSSSPTASTVAVQPVPPLPRNPLSPDDNPLVARMAALERELAMVREESERRGDEVAKYRDRWHKLKESARRKKEAKMGGGGGASPSLMDEISMLGEEKAEARQPATALSLGGGEASMRASSSLYKERRSSGYNSDTSTSESYGITLEDDGLSGTLATTPMLTSATRSKSPPGVKRGANSSSGMYPHSSADLPYTGSSSGMMASRTSDARPTSMNRNVRMDIDPTAFATSSSFHSSPTQHQPAIPLPRHLSQNNPMSSSMLSNASTRSTHHQPIAARPTSGGSSRPPLRSPGGNLVVEGLGVGRARNSSSSSLSSTPSQEEFAMAHSVRSEARGPPTVVGGKSLAASASVASGSMFYSMSSHGGGQGEEETFFEY
ncbi:hypothetical protein HDU67_001318 [Dinochytrium kinnereticum]|nr:hypothetical protein HDU67_001318 [Dinochytrium kinnereticum]